MGNQVLGWRKCTLRAVNRSLPGEGYHALQHGVSQGWKIFTSQHPGAQNKLFWCVLSQCNTVFA
jgi:hypothetical protein